MAFGDLVRSAQVSSNNTGTVSPTLAAGATAGNLLIAGVASALTGSGWTWTDPGGWTAISESGIDTTSVAANVAGKWYYKIAAGGETSVTLATSATTGSRRGVIVEFEGPFTVPPLDVAAEDETHKNTAGTTSQSTGTTSTTSQAAELAVAFFAADSATNVDGSRSYSNSFTEVIFADAADFAARAGAVLAKRVLSATGAYSCTFSVTDTGDEMYGAIATFKQDTGDPPTTALNTADATEFTTATPTVEATATDPEAHACRYNVQISDNAGWATGTNLGDSYDPVIPIGTMHPNPTGATAWNGNRQVDDRPGQSFTAEGGILDSIKVKFGVNENTPSATDGTAYVRVYAHQGTFGTSSEPLNAADPADTPTPNWLAISDAFPYAYTGGAGDSVAQRTFAFSGANRIRLAAGTKYVLVVDWVPSSATFDNALTVQVDTGLGHSGNLYIDGASVANNGVYATADLVFEVYEAQRLLDKTSGTDAGFANTVTPADTDPFNSGEKVGYTVQAGDELDNGTYYWRARATDPAGSAAYGDWAAARTFTVSASAAISRSPDVCGSTIAGLAASVALALGLGLGGLALEGLQPTVTVGDGAVDVPIAVPVGALALAGAEPTLTGTATVTPACGALGLAGYEPTILGSNAYSPDVAVLTWAGYAPALQAAYRLEPGVVALEMGGLAPDVPVTIPALPTTGSLALAGLTPDLRYDLVASPAAGGLALGGYAPALGGSRTLQPDAGSLALAGVAPDVSAGAMLSPGVGALTASGVAPAVQLALVASPATGTLALAAYAPSMAMGSVTVPIGALTLTGHAPSIQALGTAQYRQTWLVPARQTEWVIPARQTTWIA
jgi:hypothetical protein